MAFKLNDYLKKFLPQKATGFLQIIKRVIKNPDLHSPKQLFNLYRLNRLVISGQVAIIPVGFRCYTKRELYSKLGIAQASLPFDSGFFPPSAVAEILRKQRIDLDFNDRSSHTVCIKNERYEDSRFGMGIKFETSNYDEINSLAKSRDQKGLNKYLDNSYGYYTLDKKNDYVLAHYNWHKFAEQVRSDGCTEPEYNLMNINKIVNKRIQRLFDMCKKAKIAFFVYDEIQGYDFMAVDNTYFDLNNLEPIKSVIRDRFNPKSVVIESKHIKSPSHMMRMIKRELTISHDENDKKRNRSRANLSEIK